MPRKTIHLIFISLLTLSLLSTKCTKNNPPPEPQEPTLPKATQTGANTFGCKINGEIFLPNGNNIHPSISEPTYHTAWGGVGFQCTNLVDFECYALFDFSLDSCFNVGVNNELRKQDDYFSGCFQNLSGNFYLDTLAEYNSVDITRLDLTEKIISGTFQYRLISYDTGDTLSITDGRFDVGDVNVY